MAGAVRRIGIFQRHHFKAWAAPGGPSAFPIRRTAPSMAVIPAIGDRYLMSPRRGTGHAHAFETVFQINLCALRALSASARNNPGHLFRACCRVAFFGFIGVLREFLD